jgi:hypothetical protein
VTVETYIRIHAGMMSEKEQENFTYVAIEKIITLVIDQGVTPENALVGLKTFTETILNQEIPDND